MNEFVNLDQSITQQVSMAIWRINRLKKVFNIDIRFDAFTNEVD